MRVSTSTHRRSWKAVGGRHLGPPVFLFLIANLLYPSSPEGVDLHEYYYQQAPLLWGLVIAGTVLGTFLQPMVFGERVFHPANLSGIPLIAICLVLAISKNRRVHAVLGPIIILMVVLDTVLANPSISTG